MGLRQWVERVPERKAIRVNIALAAFWLAVWLIALCAPLQVVPGQWELWSLVAMGWVRVVPLFASLAAVFGQARWGLLAASVVYAAYCVYLYFALLTWGGT